MIDFKGIHEKMRDIKWASLEARGLRRPETTEENVKRARESRLDLGDLVEIALTEPEKLSTQASSSSALVSSVALDQAEALALAEDGSSPAL